MGKFLDSEFAPGIPDRGVKASLPNFTNPQKWEFVLHSHDAERAGQHFDLRLGDPTTGFAHSFVVRSWPKSGEKVLAVQQPTHTVKYMDFKGSIESGYGKGHVGIADRDQVEIIKSSPDKITFYKYKGGNTEKFSLIRTGGDQWLLLNHTSSGELGKYFASTSKYKMKELDQAYVPQEQDFITPKIDGAYATTILRPNKTPIVLSSRLSKKTGLPIEYTAKLYDIIGGRVPKSLGNTVLRTEVYAVDRQGNEVPNRLLGGMLNANVWKSRDMQRSAGTPLRLAVTDVVKYNGKDTTNLTPKAKYDLIRGLTKQLNYLDDPLELQKKIKFKEGKVIWKNGLPYKLKYKPEYDYAVQSVFPATIKKGIPRAGGIIAYDAATGVTTKVGTGFTHLELQDMLKNPDEYVGRVAKISAMEQHPSGKLRSPSFITWHLDKGSTNE